MAKSQEWLFNALSIHYRHEIRFCTTDQFITLLNLLHGKNRSILVTGIGGSGKTRLCNLISDKALDTDDILLNEGNYDGLFLVDTRLVKACEKLILFGISDNILNVAENLLPDYVIVLVPKYDIYIETMISRSLKLDDPDHTFWLRKSLFTPFQVARDIDSILCSFKDYVKVHKNCELYLFFVD